MVGNIIAYLFVALAVFFTVWRFLPKKLKQRATPTLARLLGRKISKKLETAGSCGSCDSCNACATPAEHATHPIHLHK